MSKYSGIPIPAHFPIMGDHAFTHCAGVHTHAATKNPMHYQSLNPAIIGKQMEVSLDHMSGISSIEWALEQLEVQYDDNLTTEVLEVVKSIGKKGRTVDLSELSHIVNWCNKHYK